MDNEILVKELGKMTQIFKQEKGQLSLLMLKAFDAEMNDYWNLIVSTPAYDNLTLKMALTDLVTLFNKHLSQAVLETITRTIILETTDPFVKEINQAFKVKNTVKYVYSAVISGINLEKAIIFESHPLSKKSS
ncbi:MAG: hypothetical protein DRR16_06650 [Candidatus Parabeggiatoa sp. nov. 3]|nr:MAG: hypothetical protein DRR00_11885 [Gammaproteobacteria bacterium]RKZ66924.1 MAG: hypothetical protein DRQ99_08155 [Gammaproteobacteria bacterium]RKZ87706.1 MAG: hypothetical protein DRR16_06650 [Gammaproteobacteria bacterium]